MLGKPSDSDFASVLTSADCLNSEVLSTLGFNRKFCQ